MLQVYSNRSTMGLNALLRTAGSFPRRTMGSHAVTGWPAKSLRLLDQIESRRSLLLGKSANLDGALQDSRCGPKNGNDPENLNHRQDCKNRYCQHTNRRDRPHNPQSRPYFGRIAPSPGKPPRVAAPPSSV